MLSSLRIGPIALVLVGILTGVAGDAWSARPPRARIVAAGPGAEMRRGAAGGPLRSAAAGDEVPSRAELRTAAAPLRLTLSDGTRVELAPRSRVSLLGPMDVMLDRGGKISPDRLELTAGEIRIEVPTSLRTPPVIVASREVFAAPLPGARLRARALAAPRGSASTGLSIAVDEGEARFSTKGAWKPITGGQAVDALADGPTPTPALLPPAPTWALGNGACVRWPAPMAHPPADCPIGIVAGERAIASISLAWRESQGASRYSLEIARDPAFEDIVARHLTEQRTAATPLAAGRYFARVASQGAGSLPGLPSSPREIRVVRLDVPAGATVHDGASALPRARHIELDDPSGLELAPGNTGFSRAPTRFGLIGDAPTKVRIRPTGAQGHAEISLAPSSLHAVISMTPSNAIWPTHPISLDVSIDDGGAPVSSRFEPKLVVRVNMTEVPVEWWRRGNRWRAVLAPQTPPGPWVVRVEARDAYGNEIGRAHAEVIAAPPGPVAAR